MLGKSNCVVWVLTLAAVTSAFAQATGNESSGDATIHQKLLSLKQMRDSGDITQAEYDRTKTKILDAFAGAPTASSATTAGEAIPATTALSALNGRWGVHHVKNTTGDAGDAGLDRLMAKSVTWEIKATGTNLAIGLVSSGDSMGISLSDSPRSAPARPLQIERVSLEGKTLSFVMKAQVPAGSQAGFYETTQYQIELKEGIRLNGEYEQELQFYGAAGNSVLAISGTVDLVKLPGAKSKDNQGMKTK